LIFVTALAALTTLPIIASRQVYADEVTLLFSRQGMAAEAVICSFKAKNMA
jgi:hypothetical protein